MEFLKSIVSVFHGVNTTPMTDIHIQRILSSIKRGKYFDDIKYVRTAHRKLIEGDDNYTQSRYAEIKRRLVSFSPSVTFHKQRAEQNIKSFSGLIVLDVDHVQDAISLRDRIKRCCYTYAVFQSPSGDGLKILCQYQSQAKQSIEFRNEHRKMYALANDIYQAEFDLTIDYAFDPGRLCFVSYDPNLYLNPQSDFLCSHELF